MGFSIWELLVILVIVALMFGTRKLGTFGKDLGNAVKGYRDAMKNDKAETTDDASVFDAEKTTEIPTGNKENTDA